jgi:hypothetical protein
MKKRHSLIHHAPRLLSVPFEDLDVGKVMGMKETFDDKKRLKITSLRRELSDPKSSMCTSRYLYEQRNTFQLTFFQADIQSVLAFGIHSKKGRPFGAHGQKTFEGAVTFQWTSEGYDILPSATPSAPSHDVFFDHPFSGYGPPFYWGYAPRDEWSSSVVTWFCRCLQQREDLKKLLMHI